MPLSLIKCKMDGPTIRAILNNPSVLKQVKALSQPNDSIGNIIAHSLKTREAQEFYTGKPISTIKYNTSFLDDVIESSHQKFMATDSLLTLNPNESLQEKLITVLSSYRPERRGEFIQNVLVKVSQLDLAPEFIQYKVKDYLLHLSPLNMSHYSQSNFLDIPTLMRGRPIFIGKDKMATIHSYVTSASEGFQIKFTSLIHNINYEKGEP